MSKQDRRQARDDIDDGSPSRLTDGGPAFPPDTSWKAILKRAGARDPTPEEAAEFWREHEPHMLPPDDEP